MDREIAKKSNKRQVQAQYNNKKAKQKKRGNGGKIESKRWKIVRKRESNKCKITDTNIRKIKVRVIRNKSELRMTGKCFIEKRNVSRETCGKYE